MPSGYKKIANRDFFESIDTAEKCYVLGFFIADGHIQTTEKSGSYLVGFSSNDIELLKQIRFTLDSRHNVFHSRKNNYGLYIGSKKMVEDLNNIGFYRAKTKDVFIPNVKHKNSLMRGIFDGDGCITRTKRTSPKRYEPRVVISGQKLFLNEIKKHDQIPLTGSLTETHTCWNLECVTKEAFRFLDWIYSDPCNLKMRRKYKRYIQAKMKTGFFSVNNFFT